MSWQDILKVDINSLDEVYMVTDSVWKEAFGSKGGTGQEEPFYPTLEEIEKILGRKLKAEDFSFMPVNMNQSNRTPKVKNYLGEGEFARMMELFKDEQYQLETLEGEGLQPLPGGVSFIDNARKVFKELMGSE